MNLGSFRSQVNEFFLTKCMVRLAKLVEKGFMHTAFRGRVLPA